MNDRKKSGRGYKKEKEHLIATGEMVKDPVCGAYIDSDSNITVRDGKTVHRFCSYDCRDEFLKRIGKLPGEDRRGMTTNNLPCEGRLQSYNKEEADCPSSLF